MQDNSSQEVILAEELYPINLKTINGIHFTNREIDIIAFILGGRSPKKMANFLMISHKTVASHIRNIITKLSCNSREEIIDFIEKSDKFNFIKSHYANLLIKAIFEKELKKLSNLSKNINCVIFYHKLQRGKDPFTHQLEKHLTLIKINTFSKVWEKNKSISFLINKENTQQQPVNCVIYSMSHELVKQLAHYDIALEVSRIKTLLKLNTDSIIFLLLDQKASNSVKNDISDVIYLDCAEQENYYLLVFSLLKKILHTNSIEKSIVALKKQHERLNGNTLSARQLTRNKLLSFQYPFLDKYKYYKLKLTRKLALVSILLMCIGIILFVTAKGSIHSKSNYQHTRSDSIKSYIKDNTNERPSNYIREKIFFNLPQRNINFIGREQALKQISDRLNKKKIGIITQAISGLGGIGKTQLVTEFAYRAAESKYYEAIFWIPAESTNIIYNTYKKIAYHLQLNVKGLELDNIQTLVHNKLATTYKKSKILFILDNVPGYDYISDYLTKLYKELSPSISTYILITSRSQYWQETPLVLDIFTPEEASSFVKNYLLYEKASTISKLTTTLHFFPLALGQAVTYIKRHTNIDDYLELYTAKQKDYLDKFSGDKTQYNETLWKTWNITLNKLSNSAKEILFISAYLNPDDIPFSFFENLTIEERTNGIEELRKYSFISLINNKSFKIHRLLQEVIRLSVNNNSKTHIQTILLHDLLKTDSYWLSKAMNLLESKFDFDFLQPEKWKYWSKYLPQAQAIASHAIATSGKQFKQGLKIYIKSAMFFNYIQYYGKHAITIWEEILSVVQQHYQEQASKCIIASVNTHLSNAYSWSGNYHAATDLLNTIVLPIYQQPLSVIQKDDRELLDILRIIPFKNNTSDQIRNICDLNFSLIILGNAQYKLGMLEKALVSYNKSLELFDTEQLDDISQYYKTYTLWILGRVYIDLGRLTEAEKIFEKNKNLEKLYANHPRQAHAYANLALLMYHLGNFQEAANLLVKCSKVRCTNFTPKNIRHADTQINLGFTNSMLGKITVAKQNFMNAEKIHKLYYGNTATTSVFTNLGLWKTNEALGEYSKARNYMKTTIRLSKLRYKNNIHSKMSFQITQAEVWPKLTKPIDLSYWHLALHSTNKLFGKNHYQSARYHYMLGQALEYANKTSEAIIHYKQALAILKIQEIGHPSLKKFYTKNTNAVQARLNINGVNGMDGMDPPL